MLLIIIFLIIIFNIAGWLISAPAYNGKKSGHFDGTRFINRDKIEAKGLSDLLRWMIGRKREPFTKRHESYIGKKPAELVDTGIMVTFVNHSTFLIQWNGLNILTDPIWSKRCSPFSFAGPKRMRPPGIRFEDLPPIDLVVISHNHYDHLDVPTIKMLETAYSPLFIVPLGVKAFFDQKKIRNSIELDWWQSVRTAITITSVPAQHFSGRGMFDRNRTLWSGYVLEAEDKKIYFAGDSGYGSLFNEIGKRLGPFDISLIPIGAYLPKWFMSPIHLSPEESVKVHQDVRSRQSIAMHFGTFPLADDGTGQAEEELILELEKKGIPQRNFLIPKEGIPMHFK